MKEVVVDPAAWDAIAAGYDRAARRLLTPFSEFAVRWAELDPADEVLDVASGPGTTTLLAAQKAARVQAIDFSPKMIERLEANADGMPNVSAMVGDGQQLTFPDDSFSVAFSMFGLMFFPDPIGGLYEIHRVLQPQGRVLISSWVPRNRSPMMMPMGAALMHALGPQPEQPPPEPFPFEDADSLAAGLRAGGFEAVEVQEVAPEVAIVSAEQYWADMRDNVGVNHIRKQAGSQWVDIEGRVLDHLRESLRGVDRLAMPGLIARGRKARASA